jgi:hypothetical protein
LIRSASRDDGRDLVGIRTFLTAFVNRSDEIVVGFTADHVSVNIGRFAYMGRNSLISAVGCAAINVIASNGEGWLRRRIPFEEDAVRLLGGRDLESHHADDSRRQDRQNHDRQG